MATNVFWQGNDGNLWLHQPDGSAKNLGSYTDAVNSGRIGALVNAGDARIDDPNSGAGKAAPTAPVNNASVSLTGGGAAVGPVAPSHAQVDPLLASLNSLGDILTNKNDQTNAEYGRTIHGYEAQDALDRQAHDKNTMQNEQSLTANDQAALLNAANGSTGLRGVLSSIGGLAGSGADIVRKLVGLAANQDAGAAKQTFDVNATNLGQAWGNAEQQARQRREDATATRDNNLQNNKADVLNSRQGIYEQLANLYGDQLPEGKDYASKASALSADIAGTTKASVAPYQKASSLFSPDAMKSYLAGTQNLNVNTAGGPDTPINSPAYQGTRKKDQLAGVA